MVIAQSKSLEVVEGDDNAPEFFVYLRLSELRGTFSTGDASGEACGTLTKIRNNFCS